MIEKISESLHSLTESNLRPYVAIIQSNFLPWRGYFDIIDDVDIFVIFDDVQFPVGRSFRNRNKIKTSTGGQWITVPVSVNHSVTPKIQEIAISYAQDWIKKMIRSITQSYKGAPFFETYAPGLFDILNLRCERLSELNYRLIEWVCECLEIKTKLVWSHQFPSDLQKTDRLIDILTRLNAKRYLSGPAAKAYIHNDQFFNSQIDLEYKVYDYPAYTQRYGEFAPEISVIDLLFNCGPESRQYLKSLKGPDVLVSCNT